MKKITAESKEDLWRIPEDTGILTVNFAISKSGAEEIVMRCRELHRLIIDGRVWAEIRMEVKDYLNENLHVEVAGDVEGRRISGANAQEMRRLYNMGHKSIEQLASDFRVSYDAVKRIIEKK